MQNLWINNSVDMIAACGGKLTHLCLRDVIVILNDIFLMVLGWGFCYNKVNSSKICLEPGSKKKCIIHIDFNRQFTLKFPIKSKSKTDNF